MLLSHNQSKWQSYRPFNIAILSSIIFFLLVGIVQSYTIFASLPIFTTPLYIPLILLLLIATTLFSLISRKDNFTQKIAPIACLLMTLFVSVNSHFQEYTNQNSFLYLTLLLPLFYAYLFAYNTTYLIVNNIFIAICYIFSVVLGETNALVFLFNSTFLITICYFTIATQIHNSRKPTSAKVIESEEVSLINKNSGRYLNRIIHDIRQPLSSLSLYGHLLENKLQGSPHQQLAKNIKSASEDLDRWLSGLLDLTRLDTKTFVVNFSDFTLASALSPSIKKYQFQASELGIKVSSHLPDISITSDQRLLTDIIETLLNNAIVHGNQQPGSQILLSARHHQGKVLLQIWNQGPCIDPAIINCLFDEVALADNPLHNKNKGIGLGLAIAQRKAKLCKTNIEIKTNQHGSRFSISVELAHEAKKTINLNALTNHPVNYKVLLIDDDQGILSALSMLLENWGYNVDCADTAESGLKKYEESSYDLVISDYRLPNQQTGLDVIKAIKLRSDIPAVLLTGEADPGKLKEVQETAKKINYKILNKPVKPASLRFLLKQLLK